LNKRDQPEQKVIAMAGKYSFAEFFSGGGMARIGLGNSWKCVLANDNDPQKCEIYRKNFSDSHLQQCDILDLPNSLLHKNIDLYWASSPCQDFSLAGNCRGLEGKKSSVFHPWMEQVKQAVCAGHAPKIIAFENVVGLLSARGGSDFEIVVHEIASIGYSVGALILDAKKFLPHSRPRLFVIGVLEKTDVPSALSSASLSSGSARIQKAYDKLPDALKSKWVWWNIEDIEARSTSLVDIVDKMVPEKLWFSEERTKKLVDLMNETHAAKLNMAKKSGKLVIGTVYKRGRPDNTGKIVQCAELRLDGVAGCLRTPRGGSSKQTLMIIKDTHVRARLLTAFETSKLMGLPEWYSMPENFNQAYQLAGDGVAVPVVRFLAEKIFEPILESISIAKAA